MPHIWTKFGVWLVKNGSGTCISDTLLSAHIVVWWSKKLLNIASLLGTGDYLVCSKVLWPRSIIVQTRYFLQDEYLVSVYLLKMIHKNDPISKFPCFFIIEHDSLPDWKLHIGRPWKTLKTIKAVCNNWNCLQHETWNLRNLSFCNVLFNDKTHFLILAGGAFYQVWLMHFLLISEISCFSFSSNKMWWNDKFREFHVET